ncbi:MAG TPA: DNA polymerase III subunit delta' [Levilinea sp.]|nr:DNA polymerase III subunit delta' [Levilinea sp.]
MEWSVLGHEWAVALLRRHIATGEMRHAYLFTGPSGVGRRSLALRFAQALTCTHPPAPGEPCGACRLCVQTWQMQQPDLSIVQPETETAVLKIEQVRELQHSLALSPYEAPYRVALLLDFQQASASAQNALLKTLEEAPQRVILLLVANTPESLLPTITSRCEILRLRPMPLDQLTQALQQRLRIPGEEARLLAHLSGGRLGYAIQMHANPHLFEQRQAWLDDLRTLLSASRRERFAYAESVTKGRDRPAVKANLAEMYQVWLTFWRDLLLVASGSTAPLVNLNLESELHDLIADVDIPAARACSASLEQALDRLDANLNMQLLTEVLLLDWPRLKNPV